MTFYLWFLLLFQQPLKILLKILLKPSKEKGRIVFRPCIGPGTIDMELR